MEIKINEPCHENWEAMTPNEQGAFCKSCMKSVVDFSKKSIEEIKDFFSKPQEGRVCGRFEEKQLSELNFDDFFSRFTYWNFTRKFAVIFFMVFGFWIFSNTMIAQERHLKGEVAYVPDPKPVKKDTVRKTMGQTIVKAPIMGKVKCTRSPETKQVKKDTLKVQKTEPIKADEQPMVAGMIAYIPEEKKVVQHPVKNLPNKIENKKLINILDVDKTNEDSKNVITNQIAKTENTTQVASLNENRINIFPNPSNGSFTIECKDKQTMHVFDENGKLVMKQAVSGTTLINAQHLRSGMYTIVLTGNGSPTTKKIMITN